MKGCEIHKTIGNDEYRIRFTFREGSFSKVWKLEKKYYYYEHIDDEQKTEGWQIECIGTYEFCIEALKRRENGNKDTGSKVSS